MTVDDPSGNAGSRPKRARIRQVMLALLPIVSFTTLAFVPFLWLAFIRRQRRDWAVAGAYAVALVIEIGGVLAQAQGYTIGVAGAWLVWVVLIVAPIHTFLAFRPGPAVLPPDPPGTVTISRGQGLYLRADDAGVFVRNFYFGRASRLRIAWPEISHFADGRYTKEGNTSWMLVIVRHTGKRIGVLSSVLEPPDKVVAAVRELAQAHGIPAELSGVPMKNGRPYQRGLY